MFALWLINCPNNRGSNHKVFMLIKNNILIRQILTIIIFVSVFYSLINLYFRFLFSISIFKKYVPGS
jgi:hypothetical protein